MKSEELAEQVAAKQLVDGAEARVCMTSIVYAGVERDPQRFIDSMLSSSAWRLSDKPGATRRRVHFKVGHRNAAALGGWAGLARRTLYVRKGFPQTRQLLVHEMAHFLSEAPGVNLETATVGHLRDFQECLAHLVETFIGGVEADQLRGFLGL